MGADEKQSGRGVSSPWHLLVHPDAHPLAIRALLRKRYDEDWITWDHQALWDQVNRDFNVTISELSQTKIQAIRTLETDVLFWNEWQVFGPTVMSLNNRIPNFWLVQRPTTGQFMVAVDIAGLIDSRGYSLEVGGFTASCLLDRGVVCAPRSLEFTQEYLNYPHIRCDKETRNKIVEMVENGYDALEEDFMGVQVARLTIALNYLKLRRRQLQEQLEMLNA